MKIFSNMDSFVTGYYIKNKKIRNNWNILWINKWCKSL